MAVKSMPLPKVKASKLPYVTVADSEGVEFKIVSHGLIPVEYKVIVRPVEETGTIELKGGFKLYKPDETKERDQHAAVEGELVAMSPLAFTYEQWPDGARKPRVGDTVVFARYSGNTIKGADGVEYRVMNDKDVIAIREVVR